MFLVRILALVARAFVAVCLDSCWAFLQVSVGGGAHCVGPGSSCLDVFSQWRFSVSSTGT